MVVPMKLKSQAGQALVQFIQEVGVPTDMVADGAAETTGENTEFVQNIRKYQIHLKYTEPYTPRQNFAKRMIGEIKRRWRHRAAMRSVPNRLWD
jgi:hypothetical protein